MGSLPGGGAFNIANAALYGLEGNKEEAIKSLIYAIPGADLLGKATNYAVKGGKYAKEVLAITELATYAGYEVSAMLAAGDFGNDIAGMIDKYMTGEADLSIETAEELLSLFGHAFQLNSFSSGFINVPQADFSVIPEGKYEVKFADTDPVVLDGALGDFAGSNTEEFNYYMELVEELDISTNPNTAIFYSGLGNRELAEEFAKVNGKTTLEMTPGGRYLDDMKLFKKGSPLTDEQAALVWKRLSERYAKNASGNVYGFVKGARPSSIFNTVEYPTLISNPNISNIFTELMQ